MDSPPRIWRNMIKGQPRPYGWPLPRAAVVGGGISGLAAALRLLELSRSKHLGCEVVLFEATSHLGGALWTLHEQGYQIERGVDNFITTVPWGVELCRSLGLEDQLIQTDPRYRQTFVVRKGRLHKLPEGFLMMAPTRLWPLVTTPLLGPRGKLRCALEYFLPARKDDAEESMAEFVRRRLGREACQRLVEPLVGAVYAGDLEKLSVHATLMPLRKMEREHGSLIRAMRRQMKQRRGMQSESGPRFSMFVTLREGLSSLVYAISFQLPLEGVKMETRVNRIQRAGNRWKVYFSPTGDLSPGGKTSADASSPSAHTADPATASRPEYNQPFDVVVLATPAYETARLLQGVDDQAAELLASIEHSSTVVATLAYQREQIGHALDGMGIVVPSIEGSVLLACSLSSRKYPHRAPEGKELLRVFAGGPRWPEAVEADDKMVLSRVLDELEPLLQIHGPPEYVHIARWPRSMPQYNVGHRELVAEVEKRVAALPGVVLAGNAYHGVGIPHCIHSGQNAAERVAEHLCRRERT